MVTKEQVRPVWKCLVKGCDYTGAPTVEGYYKVGGHQKRHKGVPKEKRGVQLVDETTGEVLAQTLEEATAKGLVAKTTKPEATATPEVKAPSEPQPPATETKPTPKEPPKEKKEEITEPAVSPDGIFAYTIHLPADAFALFNLAKFSGLEKDSDKPFDEWIWDCVMKRFETDYRMQLVLAPIKEEVKHG